MAKKIIGFLIVFVVLVVAVAAIFVYSKVREITYYLGDYGISIKIPAEFIEEEPINDTNLLYMFGTRSKITISATALPLNYWSSGDLDVIMDEYVRLLSAAKYECNFKDVSLNRVNINGREVGKVELTIEYRSKSYRTVTYLLGENSGNVAIEFYGEPEIVKDKHDLIERIANNMASSLLIHAIA